MFSFLDANATTDLGSESAGCAGQYRRPDPRHSRGGRWSAGHAAWRCAWRSSGGWPPSRDASDTRLVNVVYRPLFGRDLE